MADLLPPEYVTAIGRVAVNFAAVEATAHVALWDLMGIDHDSGRLLTSGLPFAQVVVRLRRVGGSTVGEWCTRAERLATLRNRCLHAPWLVFDDGSIGQVDLRRAGVAGLVEGIGIAEIDGIADQLATLQRDLITITTTS